MKNKNQHKTLRDLKNVIKDFNTFCKFLEKHKYIIDKGRLSEWYCKVLFQLKLQENPNSPYDATDEQGKKVEIKQRKSSKSGLPGAMKIYLNRISYVLFVELDKDLLPEIICRFDKKYLKRLPKNRVSFKEAYHKNKSITVYKSDKKEKK